jgi:molybdenum cofactor biosynthesis enzyme MoaA
VQVIRLVLNLLKRDWSITETEVRSDQRLCTTVQEETMCLHCISMALCGSFQLECSRTYYLCNMVGGMRRLLSSVTGVVVPQSSVLQDTFGRFHNYLRVSITEKCNLRCKYCMPAEGVDLLPNSQLLTSEEIYDLVRVFVEFGVDKIRLTGGEPLIRKDAVEIVQNLNTLRSLGLKNIAMTTNGVSLKRKLDSLLNGGLNSLNISLDTLGKNHTVMVMFDFFGLDPYKFQIVTRRGGHHLVMDAIKEAAQSNVLQSLKINCVLMRNVNDDEILDFVEMTKDLDLEVRFIE